MKENITKNRVWFLTGFETTLLGVFFLFVPDILNSGNFKEIFNLIDNTFPSILLVIIGTFTMINSAFEVEPNWHRANVFILEFIWAFYTATFLVHDIQGSDRSYISLTSILFFSVALRIFLESWLGDKGDKKEVISRHELK